MGGAGRCALCLARGGAGAGELRRHRAALLYRALQLEQPTPWLCVWCLAGVRSFYRLSRRARTAQGWLQSAQSVQSTDDCQNYKKLLDQLKCQPYSVHKTAVVDITPCVDIKPEPFQKPLKTKRTPKKELQTRKAILGDFSSYDGSSESPIDDTGMNDPFHSLGDVKIEIYSEEKKPILKVNTKPELEDRTRRGKKFSESSKDRKKEKSEKSTNTDESKEYCLLFTMTEEERSAEHEARLKRAQYVNAVFKCAKCAIGYQHKEAYVKHLKMHSPSSGPHHCVVCDGYFPTRHAVCSHEWNHYRRVKCSLCGYTGSSGMASRHYYTKHGKHSHECKQCLKKFNLLASLELHTRRMHGVRTAYRCDVCSKVFWRPESLRYHQWSHNVKGANTIFYECDNCHKKFDRKGNLKNHMKSHEPKLTHDLDAMQSATCSLCNKIFDDAQKLDRHIKSCHDLKKFQCDVCNKFFRSKCEVKIHIVDIHLKLMTHSCLQCLKVCPSKYALRRHVRTQHERVRVKDKLCDICGKGFVCRQVLEKHRYTHTGERPHACHACGLAFAQKSTLTTHFKLRHLKLGRKANLKEVPS